MGVTTRSFGKTAKGEEVTLYRIENSKGMAAEFIDYGANLVSLYVADKDGKFDDVVLGFDNIEEYQTNPCFFGSVIGRNANRIAGARFELNGKEYLLEKNEDGNNLHSSFNNGFHKRMFKAAIGDDGLSVKLSLESPDGDEGFPGNLKMSVTYRVNEDNELELIYEGISDADTILNLTNHSYFNLGGHASGTAMDHKLMIKASHFTPMAAGSIPTGEIGEVAGTPFDFTTPHVIGERIGADDPQIKAGGGYDHNFALDTEGGKCELIAELECEKTGRKMKTYTDLPGVQFYAGNFIANLTGKGGAQYSKRCGVCLETQFFPNAINEPKFISPVLKAGEKFVSITKYRFEA
ncbi:MAG: galactose mutarotase [Lachnospiraceae bacterium]|nr:galactose mutarotase [Lachnospiraceae bacterium]